MPLSHLTSGQDVLFADMLAALSDYTFSPLTQSRLEYLADALNGITGGSYSHLTTTEHRLLELIVSESGQAASHLVLSREEMMVLVANNPPLGGAPEGFVYLVNADGDFLTNADNAYLIAPEVA
jgi:hypothetical protein